MRIGIDTWGLSGDLLYTGMGQYASRLIDSLVRRGEDVELVAYSAPGEPRPAWLPPQVVWRPVGKQLPGKFSALHSRLVALPAVVTADHIDVFHAPAIHARPFFPPVPRTACMLVVTIHDVIPVSYYDIRTLPLRQQVFYRWNLKRALAADAVLTVSEASRQDITRTLHVEQGHIRVVQNGIDFEPHADRAPLDRLGIRGPYVLYAGSFEPRKNLDRALAAFADLVRQGFPHRLIAVVERTSGHAARSFAKLEALRLGDMVMLLHSLDDSTLRSLYTHADALLFPSLAEGFGYPPLQAASCGVAVVASDLPAIREVMSEAAVYVNPLDTEAMALALGSLLKDAGRRRDLATLGLERVRLFNQSAWADAHLDVYKELAGRPGAVAVA